MCLLYRYINPCIFSFVSCYNQYSLFAGVKTKPQIDSTSVTKHLPDKSALSTKSDRSKHSQFQSGSSITESYSIDPSQTTSRLTTTRSTTRTKSGDSTTSTLREEITAINSTIAEDLSTASEKRYVNLLCWTFQLQIIEDWRLIVCCSIWTQTVNLLYMWRYEISYCWMLK